MGVAVPTKTNKGGLAPLQSAARGLKTVSKVVAFGVVPVVVISTLLIFLLTSIANRDPAARRLGEFATEAQRDALRHAWGLDQPFFQRYLDWLGHALTGDLGISYVNDQPVWDEIKQRFPVNLSIALVAIALVLIVGFIIGIIAALRAGGVVDRAITAISSVALTLPPYWVAIMMVSVLAVSLRWLPSSGYIPLSEDPGQWLRHILIPSVALSVPYGAIVARTLRTSLVQALRENYVVGARVRGLSPGRILFIHALRNAAGPALATVALTIPQLFGGTVIIEIVFALPGLGQYALAGAQAGDVPVIQAVLLITIIFVLVCNFLLDLVLLKLQPANKAGLAA